jgi:hypothetical protein
MIKKQRWFMKRQLFIQDDNPRLTVKTASASARTGHCTRLPANLLSGGFCVLSNDNHAHLLASVVWFGAAGGLVAIDTYQMTHTQGYDDDNTPPDQYQKQS